MLNLPVLDLVIFLQDRLWKIQDITHIKSY